MANIDIAERLFVYAREKQQKDLANNLIKKEDVIDFSEGDFTSFNQTISTLLSGMNSEQINIFFGLLQNKINNDITDVITPNEKGFSLNIPSIVSTIKQVEEKYKISNNNIPINNINSIDLSKKDLTELSLIERFHNSAVEELEFLSIFMDVSDDVKDFILSDPNEMYQKVVSKSEESQNQMVEELKNIFNTERSGKKTNNKYDVVETVKKVSKFSTDMLEELRRTSPADANALDAFLARFATVCYHGNFYKHKNGEVEKIKKAFELHDINTTSEIKDHEININAVEAYIDQFIAGVSPDSPLYSLLGYIKSQLLDNVQSLSNEINSDQKYAENIVSNDFLAKSTDASDFYYNLTDNKTSIPVKISAMLRRSLGIKGQLPDEIQKKIEEFVENNIVQNPHTDYFEFKDDIDFDKLKEAFTFDWENDKDLVIMMGAEGKERYASDYSKTMKNGVKNLKALPDAIVSVIASSKRSTEMILNLRINEGDLKTIRPILNSFSNSEFDIDDSILCDIINESIRRDSSYTHVNTEKILQALSYVSKGFDPNAKDYKKKTSILTAAINNITFERLQSYKEEEGMPFIDFEEIQGLDINHWSIHDLHFDDVQHHLGNTAEKIRKERAYEKLFPSNVALDNGFIYDFDAYILRTSKLDPKTQIEILSNPEINSGFLSFSAALSSLYEHDYKNISSTIDRKQQELNLEILKAYFLEGVDKSILDAITVDSMSETINAFITRDFPPLATTLVSHINLEQEEKYLDFSNHEALISLDINNPGFLTPESYKNYRESIQAKSIDTKNVTTAKEEELSSQENKKDTLPIEKKEPRGLIGFVSSFVNKFKDTDKESGIFNRLKESFNYAKNRISDYPVVDNKTDNKEEGFKSNQDTNSKKQTELDSFSQSLRNEFGDTTHTTPNNDGKNISEAQKKSSDGRANSDDHDEMDM